MNQKRTLMFSPFEGAHRETKVPLFSSLGQGWSRQILLFLLLSMGFGIAFTQWPLYSENQNTKFLHGLAAAGMGSLQNDWLANTVDPLPVFSTLVFLTSRFATPRLFYLYHALLLGLYLYSLGIIVSHIFPLKKSSVGLPLFYVVVIALHSSLLPPFSLPLMGTSVGWLLQAGVANQYLFNPVLQPSTFGVLLTFSIALLLQERPYWATVSAAVAAIIHSTYLPGAAALIVAYLLLHFWKERNIVKTLGIGLLALGLVLPVLLYNMLLLGPTSAELWGRAQEIIVQFRIPHHSLPAVWMDDTVYVKIGIVLLAMFLVIRTRLFWILLVCLAIAVSLTALQMRIDNDTLAFVAPWRISVFLVPLSTALIIAFIISSLIKMVRAFAPRQAKRLRAVGWSIILLLLVASLWRGALAIQDSFRAQAQSDMAPLWRFVQEMGEPDSVYLVPTQMAEFRLKTGLPVVVTYKSHPYKDVEVIEWWDRVNTVNAFYADPRCAAIESMADRYGVTHLLLERGHFLDECNSITNIYLDDRFGIFRVEK